MYTLEYSNDFNEINVPFEIDLTKKSTLCVGRIQITDILKFY